MCVYLYMIEFSFGGGGGGGGRGEVRGGGRLLCLCNTVMKDISHLARKQGNVKSWYHGGCLK